MLLDVAAQNASLQNDYGATKGSHAPSSLEVALYVGDPANGGVELDSAGGYARYATGNNGTFWPSSPADGALTSAAFSFPTPTGAWTSAGVEATATHFVLIDGADHTTRWDSGPLVDPVSVSDDDAGVPVSMPSGVTVYYSNL